MDDAIQIAAVMLFFGPIAFVWGLRCWQKKRLLENIPSSKIRSAAMGRVEIRGVAHPRTPMLSLLTQRPCCWWRYAIEEYRSNGKNSRWVTIATLQSPEPFLIKDETGQLLVDPQDAETYFPKSTYGLNDLPSPQARDALTMRGISVSGWWGFDKKIRVVEERLDEFMPLYVLGELTHRVNFLAGRRDRLNAHIRSAKQDSERMAQADANQDGILDPQEWDAARRQLESEFLAKEATLQQTIAPEDNLVLRAPSEGPFILAAGDEEKLISSWTWGAPIAIVGGVALMAGGVWVMPNFAYQSLAIFGIMVAGFLTTLLRSKKGVVKWVS